MEQSSQKLMVFHKVFVHNLFMTLADGLHVYISELTKFYFSPPAAIQRAALDDMSYSFPILFAFSPKFCIGHLSFLFSILFPTLRTVHRM